MLEPKEKSILWKGLSQTPSAFCSVEHARLRDRSLESTIIALDENLVPFTLVCQFTWNSSWHVLTAHFRSRGAEGQFDLELNSDGAGTWTDAYGHTLKELNGCLDIDVWPTPFTNTFPLRRIQWSEGIQEKLEVVFVEAPFLTVRKAFQAYTCLSPNRYLFESLDSGYAAELNVDDQRLVNSYAGLFQRIG